jgi:Cu(I)/Ag(I) efflux system membrane fusion protein
MTLEYLPGKKWQGEVDYIYPTLDAKTRTLKVRLRFSNENGSLKPNMFAQVSIHSRSTDNILLVPKEAVIRTGNSDRVVIARGEGRFKSIEVKVGRYDDQFAEVLEGLNEGDKVVTSAQFLLDSESSKTSDFNRMNHEMDTMDASAPKKVSSAEVDGVINTIMVDHRMLNISRGAIPEWNRPAATVDFFVDDQIDLANLKKGLEIHFRFIVDDGKFVITKIMPQSTETKHDNH